MENPTAFKYGTVVSSHYFTNRESETRHLIKNFKGGIHTIIMSPRRWGKSSLVEKVLGDLRKQQANIKTVRLDLFSVGNEKEFLEMFAREVIKASSSKWDHWVAYTKEFLQSVVPNINLGVDPKNDFTLSFHLPNVEKKPDEILNLPEAIAQKKNIRFVICVDEFQNLAELKSGHQLEKKMRALWQHHERVTYCLYGSKRHMMNEIFNNPSKPFYRFGDLIPLGKIKTEDWVNYIIERYKATGKSISPDVARLIPAWMENHPWYVQQLGNFTWQISPNHSEYDHVLSALEDVINSNLPFFQKTAEELSPTQLHLLKAIAMGESRLNSKDTIAAYNLGTGASVTKNKKLLLEKDLIDQTSKGFELLDPAFRLWLLKQYFNRDYESVLSEQSDSE